jgi:hypothetical protein
VILDDATSEIYYAQLAPEESIFTVMAGLRTVIEQKGLFCSLYSDHGAHFWLTPKSGGKVDYDRPTQVGHAMKELGVHMIPAYSPHARGRSERNFSTWQGRLPQELRLRGIGTLEGANQFLNDHYIAEFNRRFTVPAVGDLTGIDLVVLPLGRSNSSQHQRMGNLHLFCMWKPVIVDPAGKDRCFHGDRPGLGKGLDPGIKFAPR